MMAVAYKKKEMLSASKMARSFGQVLADLSGKRRRRVAVVKNNHLEAILLPVEDYETMAEALALLEHLEIYHLVQERKRKKTRKSISLDALLKEQRLAV
jgi:PHD/YefM family antitoxin component YafN of YafNO toxin-antitoxin module